MILKKNNSNFLNLNGLFCLRLGAIYLWWSVFGLSQRLPAKI